MKSVVLLIVTIASVQAYGWGKRGHQIVNVTAAYLLANDAKLNAHFMRRHSFDLGYYANIPDIGWRAPATSESEAPQHFMDMEIFVRELKDDPNFKKLDCGRAEMEKTFPNIKPMAGRAWWRIREMQEDLLALTEKLKNSELQKKDRQTIQLEWLTRAGTMGHYVGDLAQPLHTTEDYDGKERGQKGIHEYFETESVDVLYPQLEAAVMKDAQKQWPAFHSKNAKLTVFELVRDLTLSSHKRMNELFKIDKKLGRKDIKKAGATYSKMLQEQMVRGSLALAELWSRGLGWPYNGEKFYNFNHSPEYFPPKQ